MTTPIEDFYEKPKSTAIGKNAALELAIASGSVPPEVIGNGKARNPTLRLTIRSKLFWHVQVMHFKRGAISMMAAGMVN
jgi:hypothetical protein